MNSVASVCVVAIILSLPLTSCATAENSSVTSVSVSSQASQPAPGTVNSAPSPLDRVTVADVEAIAKNVDMGFEDGWIAGRDARVFKSPYKKLSARDKASFAVAYHDWLEPFHQDLGNTLSTYVPYKKRSAFAREYWQNSSSSSLFKSAIEKYQVAWIHESLLDGSELWWRAAEKRFGNRINSVLTLVHDTEQNMVSKYMEDEKSESTFSAQMSDKTKKPEK